MLEYPLYFGPDWYRIPVPGSTQDGIPPVIGRCHPYARKSASEAVLSVIGCSSPFMRLSQHLTALRAWYKQCLPGR